MVRFFSERSTIFPKVTRLASEKKSSRFTMPTARFSAPLSRMMEPSSARSASRLCGDFISAKVVVAMECKNSLRLKYLEWGDYISWQKTEQENFFCPRGRYLTASGAQPVSGGREPPP